ncbi:hypothetical protein DPMN_064545 [Dreissena polymorpha]|uniref:F5/8 type C domain-containing protein n=1 Tax=Dreissena polymorpha TaxID=45954 RepID=A0A9D4CDD4_DREPO|nr:hypothetical protein DPMN_064545 [Dreissena polymorpha]
MHESNWTRYFKPYIQVDLLATYDVTGVTILGRADGQELPLAYTFLISTNGVHFSPLMDTRVGDESKSFDGNTDRYTPVTRNFTAVTARWIRFISDSEEYRQEINGFPVPLQISSSYHSKSLYQSSGLCDDVSHERRSLKCDANMAQATRLIQTLGTID